MIVLFLSNTDHFYILQYQELKWIKAFIYYVCQWVALTISVKITILNKALCRVVWRRKNYRKNQQITRTAVLPAPLTFCVEINRLPVGNPPENTVFIISYRVLYETQYTKYYITNNFLNITLVKIYFIILTPSRLFCHACIFCLTYLHDLAQSS